MSVVACLLALLQLSFLRWLKTHVVSSGGCSFALRNYGLPQGLLHHEILRDDVQDARAEPSSANWAAQVDKHVQSCQRLLLMMVQFSLRSPKFVAMLLANLMRSGRACMLLVSLRSPKGPSGARIITGLRALVQCESHTFSCP